MNAAEHYAEWLKRYGDVYATDDERQAAYRDFQTTLAEMHEIFGLDNEPRTKG